jgi:hypothetical protein
LIGVKPLAMVAFTTKWGWSFPFDYDLRVSMGCTIAVYDCVSWKKFFREFPKKELVGAERSRARRGTKRRGRRGTGGNTRRRQLRRERKSRSVVAADPPRGGQYRIVQDVRPIRRDYLRSRGKAYGARVKDKVVALYSKLNAVSSRSTRDSRRHSGQEESVRRRFEAAKKQWMWVYCSQSGEPPELAAGLLNVILTVSTSGWGALPSPSVSGEMMDRQVRPAPPSILEPTQQVRRGARFVQQCAICRVCYETRSQTMPCPKCHPRSRQERLETAAALEDARRRRKGQPAVRGFRPTHGRA